MSIRTSVEQVAGKDSFRLAANNTGVQLSWSSGVLQTVSP